MTKSNDVYFAHLQGQEFIDAMQGKINDFHEDLRNSGLRDVIERSYRAYYGADLNDNGPLFESNKLTRGGKQGELTHLKTNHYRNLVKHILQLATSQKPAFSARANNTDYKSQAQTILAGGLVDYYLREHKLSRYLTQAVELGLISSEGWIHCPWNPSKGEKYSTDNSGKPLFQGDIEFTVHSILDVIRDINKTHEDKNEWLCVRNKPNKWNLIAKYPELTDKLLSIQNEQEDEYYSSNFIKNKSEELITSYTFYHEVTEALPQGRLVIFTGDVILFDGPLPYVRIPLFRLIPDKLVNTPYGYSPAFDILGPQQAIDILTSTIMSNQASTGVQSIWSQRGDAISVSALSAGLKHFQSDTPPQPIQLTKTAPEIFNFRQQLIGEQETLVGISSTIRGNPEANLKSGSALALMVSQSIQFASLLEQSSNELLEDVGTCIISHLRQFSTTSRVAILVGNFNRPFMREFNADDLSQINRVVVEQTSPLSKTISGRVEIANQLLQQGFIENPKQYLTVLQTGQLDAAIEGSQSSLLNIRAENESLQNGELVKAVITENHADHIKEHKSILENPEAKKNGLLVKNVLAHIQEHIDLWRSADPAILQLTGQQPAPLPNQSNSVPAANVMKQEQSLPGQLPVEPNPPNLPNEADPNTQAAYEKAFINQ